MGVARVTAISATSPDGFDEAIKSGLNRASKTLRNIKSAWVKDQNVMLSDGDVKEFKVNLLVTFELDE